MAKDKRPSSAQRGYGHDWRKFRAAFLKKNPMCCRQGCRELATDVDHEPPLEGKDDPGRLDEKRCASLCHAHHSEKTGKQTAAKYYDEHRESMAAKSRKRSEASRELGEIPPIANIKRREKCRDSLKLFCETYNPAPFYFGWSESHLKAISRIEESVRHGSLFAFAMPRGSGKTTLCRMALLWATAYAHCRYVFLIGATSDKAEDTLDSVKMSIRFLKEFAEDFPEISVPANRLNGIANRASGQTCGGESTLIEWSKDTVVFPTVPVPSNWPKKWKKRSDGKAPTSGVILATSGLTGEGIRGSLKTLTNGEYIRPDLVLLDDPQTTESACSLAQNSKRLSLITSDVLGMAGPGRSLAGVMPCTVIARGDMVDEVLDRKKHPLWRGERTKMLSSFPDDLKAWDSYFDIYETCVEKEPPDFTESNEYYLENRDTLDKGALATWEDRKLKTEVSAVQSAMHLYHRDSVGFMAEYQNEPLDVTLLPGSRRLAMEHFIGRHTGLPRGVVPRDCSKLTAFIDLGGYLHWYCVVAWNESFGGSVIDYGSWPRQNNATYTKEDARMKLEDAYPGHSQDQYVYQGLMDLGNEILNREYVQENTGAAMRLEIAIADSGFKDDIASDFVRAATTRGTRLEISKGVPRATGRSPVGKWDTRPGESGGWNWRRSLSVKKKVYMIQFDTDAFKGFIYDRWTERVGGRSCLRIFGDEKTDHRLFFGHQTAECGRVDPEKKQGELEKWTTVPNSGVDNDFFDCVVGAALAASVTGLKWTAGGTISPKVSAKPISLRELQQQRRAEKERRMA